MAKSPEVKVRITADTSDLDKAVNKTQSGLSDFARRAGVAAGAAAVAVGAAMVALTRQSMAAIDAQAKLAQSLGTTVSSIQTLQRAGELAGVSMEGIQQATSDLTRRLSQAASGAGPVADALKRLQLTSQELAAVPLDQRVMMINQALEEFIPATERAAVAGQLFGEEGSLAMTRIDTATLRQATEDVQRFGVAVSETDADNIESANDAVSRLGLAMTGLGNIMAAEVAPKIEVLANGLANFVGQVMGFRIELEEFFGTLENARASLGEDVFNRLLGNPALIREHAEALDVIAAELVALQTVAATAAPQFRIFADELDGLGESGAADAMRVIADEANRAEAEFAAGTITAEQFQERMAEIISRAQGIATEFENINGAEFSTAFANIQGLAERLWEAAKAAAAVRANLPGGAGEMTMAPDGGGELAGLTGEGLLPPSSLAPGTSIRPQQQGVDSFGNWQDAASGGGGGGGAGGGAGGGGGQGIQELFAERLEALQEGLMTESEVIKQWYDEGLMTLQDALDQQLISEEQYRELRERLEAEHQDRLGRIRDLGNQSAIAGVLGAGQEILSAIGQTNSKALKVAKVFGAAQALISAYQGAAEALKLPFPKNIAAAAAVLAKGIGFVNAIRSVNDSGAGASSAAATRGGTPATVGAGGGGGTAEAAQAPTQTLNFQITNDPFGFGERIVRQLASQLNEASRNGAAIRATVS